MKFQLVPGGRKAKVHNKTTRKGGSRSFAQVSASNKRRKNK